MRLPDYPLFRRGPRRRRAPAYAACARPQLYLELLESRSLPSVVTFAQFLQLNPVDQNFVYTNTGTSASFSTITGGDPVLLVPNSSIAPTVPGPQRAHLLLSATTSTPAMPILPPAMRMSRKLLGLCRRARIGRMSPLL